MTEAETTGDEGERSASRGAGFPDPGPRRRRWRRFTRSGSTGASSATRRSPSTWGTPPRTAAPSGRRSPRSGTGGWRGPRAGACSSPTSARRWPSRRTRGGQVAPPAGPSSRARSSRTFYDDSAKGVPLKRDPLGARGGVRPQRGGEVAGEVRGDARRQRGHRRARGGGRRHGHLQVGRRSEVEAPDVREQRRRSEAGHDRQRRRLRRAGTAAGEPPPPGGSAPPAPAGSAVPVLLRQVWPTATGRGRSGGPLDRPAARVGLRAWWASLCRPPRNWPSPSGSAGRTTVLPDRGWQSYEDALRRVGERRPPRGATTAPGLPGRARAAARGPGDAKRAGQAYFNARFITGDGAAADAALHAVRPGPLARDGGRAVAGRRARRRRGAGRNGVRSQGFDGVTDRSVGSLLKLMDRAGLVEYDSRTSAVRVLDSPVAADVGGGADRASSSRPQPRPATRCGSGGSWPSARGRSTGSTSTSCRSPSSPCGRRSTGSG